MATKNWVTKFNEIFTVVLKVLVSIVTLYVLFIIIRAVLSKNRDWKEELKKVLTNNKEELGNLQSDADTVVQRQTEIVRDKQKRDKKAKQYIKE